MTRAALILFLVGGCGAYTSYKHTRLAPAGKTDWLFATQLSGAGTGTSDNAPLPELRSFVLPGGTEAASRLHVARAVCRRAEREVLEAGRARPVNPLAAVYLNRLSDLLFVLARAANAGDEPLWRPGAG